MNEPKTMKPIMIMKTGGTPMLDFVDAKTRQLVFCGTGKGTVGSTEANAKSLQEAMGRWSMTFPEPSHLDF